MTIEECLCHEAKQESKAQNMKLHFSKSYVGTLNGIISSHCNVRVVSGYMLEMMRMNVWMVRGFRVHFAIGQKQFEN